MGTGYMSLIFNIIIIVAVVYGLYRNPNVETFLLIVLVVSMYYFYTRRYWRNLENLRS
jgi:hypothetical protein